ncbi:MAG: molybdate ABC transporter substrate-binding protein [Desulfovibrio sp.]|nr:molybdate ABC transporter substrate-binding protein [Desulfovibrio sp.]
MRTLRILSCIFAFLLAATSVQADQITVSAAASLTNAFTDIKNAFEKLHPEHQVFVNFAASNPLLKQIKEGAAVDVFASADQDTMDLAAKDNLIDPKTRTDFVRNTLVLIAPKNNTKIKKLDDIKKSSRIAIGKPESVPAGRYTQEALTQAKLWDSLQSTFIYGNSVRQVLDYVARDEVDCGFVYGTDAQKRKDAVNVVTVMQGHKPILYPIAIVKTGKNPKTGQAFIDFVLSEQGRSILNQHGFSKP